MEDIIKSLGDNAFSLVGNHGTAAMVILIAVSLVCRVITKLVPDDSTGIMHVVRIVTGAIGLYASNRLSSGVKEKDAVRTVGLIARSNSKKVDAIQDVLTSPDVNVTARGPAGKFKKVDVSKIGSPGLVSLLVLGLLLAACTTTQIRATTDAVCQGAAVAQQALQEARAAGDRGRVERLLNHFKLACPSVLLFLDLTASESNLVNNTI